MSRRNELTRRSDNRRNTPLGEQIVQKCIDLADLFLRHFRECNPDFDEPPDGLKMELGRAISDFAIDWVCERARADNAGSIVLDPYNCEGFADLEHFVLQISPLDPPCVLAAFMDEDDARAYAAKCRREARRDFPADSQFEYRVETRPQ